MGKTFVVPAERVRERTLEWAPYVCADVFNIVNPASRLANLILVRMTTGCAHTCHLILTSV